MKMPRINPFAMVGGSVIAITLIASLASIGGEPKPEKPKTLYEVTCWHEASSLVTDTVLAGDIFQSTKSLKFFEKSRMAGKPIASYPGDKCRYLKLERDF